jgi:F1F0 ATPase subunit 2
MTLVWALIGVGGGACLGLAFFGALWWTTQRLVTARVPGLLLAGSLIARLGILALGLIVLARADTAALVGALFGLIGVRIVVVRAASHPRLGSLADGAHCPSERT